MAIPVLQDAKLRLTDCIYFGDAIAEAAIGGSVPNGSITLVKLASEVTAVALGGAAAVHTHVGLLSGLLTGYIPVGNDATSLVNGPLFSDGVSVGLGTNTPSDALHVRRSGSRSALFLDGQGAGGYAALKIECDANMSAFLVAAGYVDGDGGLPSGAGFSIRDTNANSDRLVIYNSGIVDVPGTLSQGGTQVSVVGHTHANTDISGLGTMSVQNANAVAITGGSASGLTSLSAGSVTATGAASVGGDLSVVGTSQGRIRDKGGQVFNVKAFGAEGGGSTDNTTAIAATIAAAAAVKGAVLFPPGTYNTSGGFSLNGLNGLKILGSGPGSTVIRITHATNDLFSVGATITSNIEIGGFTVTSDTVTRTGGWVFHVNNAYNGTGALTKSRFHNLEIRKQVNGLGIKKYAFVSGEDILIWDGVGTSGRAVQFGQTTASNVNQGSEARFRNVQVHGNDLAGSAARFGAGFWIEDCDAVELTECATGAIAGHGGVMLANAGGHAPSNHFIQSCIFDATDTGHAFWITGGGYVLNVKINGSWFASAGQMAGTSNGNGLRCDALSWASGELVGNNFYNNRGTGLYIASSSASVTVTGNTLNSNGGGAAANNNDGIYLGLSVNSLGPVICGNQEIDSNGVGIRTGANTNRIVVTGNRWVSGTAYGTPPFVDANNGS